MPFWRFKKKRKKFEPLTVCLHWSGGYTIVYLFYVTIVSSGPVHAFIYKCSHFIHVFILEREFAACFTWKMAILFATSWLFGKTEAELRGGGVRWWRGPPWPLLSSPPSISPSQLLLHWDGLRETPPPPPPLARRHPATKYNTNSIKCSLRCDLTAMNDKLVVVLTL